MERRRGRPAGSPSKAFSQPTPSAAESRIAELERLLGRKQLELDFFKRAFEHVRGATGNRISDGGKGIYRSIEASLSFEGEGLTVERQCQLAEVSRAGSYRYLQQSTPVQADLLLRARLQELAVEHRRVRGYRLLTRKLRREGHLVNHKRVLPGSPCLRCSMGDGGVPRCDL